ncbi:MAG: hypothetical protein QM757_24725 [Paludibaculum sp.]
MGRPASPEAAKQKLGGTGSQDGLSGHLTGQYRGLLESAVGFDVPALLPQILGGSHHLHPALDGRFSRTFGLRVDGPPADQQAELRDQHTNPVRIVSSLSLAVSGRPKQRGRRREHLVSSLAAASECFGQPEMDVRSSLVNFTFRRVVSARTGSPSWMHNLSISPYRISLAVADEIDPRCWQLPVRRGTGRLPVPRLRRPFSWVIVHWVVSSVKNEQHLESGSRQDDCE